MTNVATAVAEVRAALPPADWYPDPTGERQLRWWGGLAWTEHVKPIPAPVTPHSYLPANSTYVPFAQSAAESTRRPVPRSANTLPIWLMAASPLLWGLAQIFPYLTPLELLVPLAGGLNITLLIIFVGLAVWDRLALRAMGLCPSSAWWFLLPNPVVYLIVRRVTLKRQGVISNAPSNVFVLALTAAIGMAYISVAPIATERLSSLAEAIL
ncbi:MAG: DUF2510 domain-containing protein [Rhodoglobus sp.]